MNARDRFEPPTAEAEHAINSVYQDFGNPQLGQGALSPALSQELKQAGEDIEQAKKLTETSASTEAAEITVETHVEAATRTLAVWNWLANAREKFAKSGQKAEDVAVAIERYERLYNKMSPQMGSYIEYLLKWFF